jgi:sugar lactone lactonase YvrE
MSAQVFDDRICALGEGPLWHPVRQQFFWFDIDGKRLLTQEAGKQTQWQFDEYVTAAGWIDETHLLMASESALWKFDLTTAERVLLVRLEQDMPLTRSNDGRADPWGGFWIGTMAKEGARELGSIYRFYQGRLRKLYASITCSNAICFSPDRHYAYFTDTPTRLVMQQALDSDGWPAGAPSVLIDTTQEGLNPDGAVVDSQGCLWVAQWGASRVARYDADGNFLSAVGFDATQISCPAFGGADLTTLLATSAACGVKDAQGGLTFSTQTSVRGQQEHRIIL